MKSEVQDTQPETWGNASYFLKQGPGSKRLVAVILRNPEKNWDSMHVAVRYFQQQHADKTWGIINLTF